MRGYREAERQGLIQSFVGRGTFVRGGPMDEQPQARVVADDTSEVIDLSANRPLYALDPPLGPVLSQLSRDATLARLTRYVDVLGMSEHTRIGATWLEQWGVPAGAGQVVVCAGAQHAVFTALNAVAAPGQAIATEALTYASLKPIAATLGVRLHGVAMDEGGLLPSALAAACTQRRVQAIYCMPTVQNPTGSMLAEGRRREIVAIAREHDIMIIEDDIHRLYRPDAPPTLAAMAPERTIFIAATSKCLAGGLRVAFMSCPERLQDNVRRIILSTIWNTSPLMVEIACRWIQDGTASATVEQKRKECASRHELARRLLPRAEFFGYAGGLSAWIGLPPEWTSGSFALEAQRHGVLVGHDAAFAVGETPRRACVRLSLSAPVTQATLVRGLQTLAMIMRTPNAEQGGNI